jgi:hypothetical protein
MEQEQREGDGQKRAGHFVAEVMMPIDLKALKV